MPCGLPTSLLSAPACFGRIGEGTSLILGPSPPTDGRGGWASGSTPVPTRGWGLPVFTKQAFGVWGHGVGDWWVGCAGISLGALVGKHIGSDLLCMGLPLSTFTPSRDNARPEGTRGPSHRDRRASLWGFLLLLYWWPQEPSRPMDAPAESSHQALSSCLELTCPLCPALHRA